MTLMLRLGPSSYGWALIDTATFQPIVVEGSVAVGLTRWECRQTLGLLGLTNESNE